MPRPSWYQSQRKRAFHPLARRKPSRRREQVREMLPRGIGVTEIARRLGISTSTAGTHASRVYRQLCVQSHRQLLGRRAQPAACELAAMG